MKENGGENECPKSEVITHPRVALIGASSSGKSGLANRLWCEAFSEEASSTSEIEFQLLGFSQEGGAILPQNANLLRKDWWPELMTRAWKQVKLIDLCGEAKYLKTVYFGLSAMEPDYALLLVDAERPLDPLALEHLGMAVILEIPTMVVISRCDLVEAEVLETRVAQVEAMLHSFQLGHRILRNSADLQPFVQDIINKKTTPIFTVSARSGSNVDLLRRALFSLPARPRSQKSTGLSLVVTGTGKSPSGDLVLQTFVQSGVLKIASQLVMGPFNGRFLQSNLKSLYHNHLPVEEVPAGSICTVVLKFWTANLMRKMVERGMCLFENAPALFDHIEANALVLASEGLKVGQTFILLVDGVSRNVRLERLDDGLPRVQAFWRGQIRLKVFKHPIFARTGSVFVLREGTIKLTGVITRLFEVGREFPSLLEDPPVS